MQANNAKVIFTIFIILSLVVIGYFVYRPTTTPILPSTFSLSPTPSPQPTSESVQQPLVTSWTTYTNHDYNFTISIPDGWKQQEYKLPSGVFLVAFSPNDLPCGTCTYVHEGYFSVKIFDKTNDPQAYDTFTKAVTNIGKVKGYIAAQIDKVQGVLYANTVEIPNHGLVYQITLDENNGTMDISSSQIFQKAASSLQFTYLIFEQ